VTNGTLSISGLRAGIGRLFCRVRTLTDAVADAVS
jgi:hypothetical protein